MDDHGQPDPDPALAPAPPGIPWYLQRSPWGPEGCSDEKAAACKGQNSRAGIQPALLLCQVLVKRSEGYFWPERCLERRYLFGVSQWT